MPWYAFPTSEENMVAHMMNRLQNGAKLTQGPLVDLNYETASDVNEFHLQIIFIIINNQLFLLLVNERDL